MTETTTIPDLLRYHRQEMEWWQTRREALPSQMVEVQQMVQTHYGAVMLLRHLAKQAGITLDKHDNVVYNKRQGK